MKKFLFFLLLGSGYTYAQTTINTPTVSGTWNLAGSPYIIQNEISVQANDVLTIEPGVEVKFQPTTRMEVLGQLIASGTFSNPIIFEAFDTTGWHNQLITTGGWSGIHIKPYAGSGTDNSIMNYCTIKDAKYGYATVMNYVEPLTIERGMKLHHATITHNQTSSGAVGSGACLRAQLYNSADTLDIDHCDFSYNDGHPSVINVTNPVGFCNFTNGHIHHNERGSGITGLLANMLIENNEIDHNNTIYDSAPLYINAEKVVVRGNHIHHNVSPDHGGVTCNYGEVTIENNFIHNNYQTDASCGISEGGGGLNLTCFSSDLNDAFFIVRNNIIANNYSALGGGGINVYQAVACITNNHIINNYSPNLGQAILITQMYSRVYMRNNLFYNQSGPGNIESYDLIHVYNGSGIWFDYNFITSNYSEVVRTGFSYTLYGDTSHNVIGTNPGIILPTADNSYLTDAGTANFNINAGSPCINAGDTIGAYSSPVDYAYNSRIVNIIDIGAYEYGGNEPSGIEQETISTPLLVFPNPTESHSNFMVDLPEPNGDLMIFDLHGKIVYHQSVNTDLCILNLGDKKGIFFIQFKGATTQGRAKIMIR
jgi:hypothetical protein